MTTQRDASASPPLRVSETLSRFPTNITSTFKGVWTSRACTPDEIQLASIGVENGCEHGDEAYARWPAQALTTLTPPAAFKQRRGVLFYQIVAKATSSPLVLSLTATIVVRDGEKASVERFWC